MRWIRAIVSGLCVALLIGATQARAGCDDASDPSCVTLRSSRYPINLYYMCLVARYAFAERVSVEEGKSLTGLIRERCGHADKDYQTIFQSIPENKAKREVLEGGEIIATASGSFIFPACLYARDYLEGNDTREPPTQTISRQTTLKEIAETFSGAGPELLKRRIDEIYNANRDAIGAANTDLGETTVEAGTSLKIPVLLKPRSFNLDLSATSRAKFLTRVLSATQANAFRQQDECRLARDFTVPLAPGDAAVSQAEATAQTLAAANAQNTAAPQAANAVSQAPKARNSPVTKPPPAAVETCADRQVEPLPSNEGNCTGEVSGRYPVDWSALREVLTLEDVASSNRDQAIVILTDSGLLGINRTNEQFVFPEAFPKKVFYTANADKTGNADTVGINLQAESASKRYYPPYYYENQPGKEHGTHVAGIIMGQGEPANRVLIEDRLKLFVLNVFASDKSSDPKCSRNYFVKNDELEKLVGLTEIGSGFKIFNMSLETYSILQRPKNADDVLFVAASGNAGIDYSQGDETPPYVYPARWKSKVRNVISVGGHDSTRVHTVGNSGRKAVDLLAPACKIRSITDPGKTPPSYSEMSGTSQATPFVTLAAALLRNLYPNLTSEEIKYRLMDAADYEPALDKESLGGVLNLPASLAARFAVLKMRGTHKLRYGRISQARLWACWSGKPSEVVWGGGQIRRLAYSPGGEKRIKVNVRWEPDSDQGQGCELTKVKADAFLQESLEFEEATIITNNGQSHVAFKRVQIPFSEIGEIVPQARDSAAEGPVID